MKTWELGRKTGDVHSASLALMQALRFSMIAGEKLPSLQNKYDQYLKQVIKYNKEAAKSGIVDKMSIDFLMGVETSDFSIFE